MRQAGDAEAEDVFRAQLLQAGLAQVLAGGEAPARLLEDAREAGLGSEERIEDLPIFDLEKLLRTPPFNPHEMSALQSIFDEVSLLAHSTNDDLNTIIMRIKTIEEKYLQDEGIENDEAFFGALSTMRFSSHLWGRNPSTRKRGGRGWWKVVLSDCIGFGVGTFLDGPATGIDLGVGMSRVVAGTLK